MDHAPPAPPRFRSERCQKCTNEVLVDFYHEGATPLCEYCSGTEKGFHEKMREARERPYDPTAPSANAKFLERLESVLARAVPNPQRPGAFGRCAVCDNPYVLSGDKLVHPGTCYPRKKS